ncbi:MAG TPA: alpha/beta hydrolase, partial [Planctomycetota bacterium]|nr:alpha/beta hydrolase [Planctomycetota bacterium]
AVVVLHGWGTCRSGPHRMLVELCRELARAGMPALRFDLSGRGDSGGDFWAVGLDDMIADARAAGGWLSKAAGTENLALAGLCSGANVALGAACGEARFTAVAALSALPFQKQRGAGQAVARTGTAARELGAKALSFDTWRRLFRGEVAVGRILRRLLGGEGGKSAKVLRPQDGDCRLQAQPGTAGSRYPASSPPPQTRNLKDSARDIQAELAGCKARLLFIHGGADAEGQSGWTQVFEPFLMSSGADYRHETIAGADHDYHDWTAKRQAIGSVVAFLGDRAGG